MTPESVLHARRRPLTDPELLAIPWMRLLTEEERARAATDLKKSARPITLRRHGCLRACSPAS